MLFLNKANFPKFMFPLGERSVPLVPMSDLRPCRAWFERKPLHRKVPGRDHGHFPVGFYHLCILFACF